MRLLLLKQGDPGIRGPMGNPGKEGPKVDTHNCAQQNKASKNESFAQSAAALETF